MNPTIAQMLVSDHQQALQAEAAHARLAATAKTATRSSSTGTMTGTRRMFASLASVLVAVVR